MKAAKNGEPQVGRPGSGRSDVARMFGSGLFPVIYSIPAAEALLAEVARVYAIDTPVTCQLLRRGLHDTYLVTTRDDRYIARVYRMGGRSLPEIAYELELLAHLAVKGVSVSLPIAARDGARSRPLLAPEGTRQLVLFTYAAGQPLSWNEEEHCYLAGRVLAAIHAASEGFVSQHVRFALDLAYLIDAPLAAIRPFLAHRPEDWRYLEGLAGRLRARVEAVAGRGLEWGVCHGDFGGNIHIAADQTPRVFDFDFCGPGWRAYDFVAAYGFSTGWNRSGIWGAFLRGYTATRRLGAVDLAAVPLFRAISRLWSLGLRAENAIHRGALSVTPGHLDQRLTFFRKWEAEHP
jgi:Ser/Thr protein kinase RdoA (MazF antagonist)